jgi:hypothetical protein
MQIGLVVENVENAAREWCRLLGVAPPEIVITDPQEMSHTEYRQKPTPARAKIAFIKLGQVTLELIEPVGGPSTWKDQLDSCGPSLHHIAFEIKGMPGHVERLAGHGLTLLQRGDYKGGRYAYLEGGRAMGAVVELLEND